MSEQRKKLLNYQLINYLFFQMESLHYFLIQMLSNFLFCLQFCLIFDLFFWSNYFAEIILMSNELINMWLLIYWNYSYVEWIIQYVITYCIYTYLSRYSTQYTYFWFEIYLFLSVCVTIICSNDDLTWVAAHHLVYLDLFKF